ncbi:methyltransferase domain-containing protein [Desertihabitans brevis]|uniref:Methyltransferase domain-containing protein n=1 Tax=Desertihabitans brevis TaxID=2268447 RepID=A0A367YSY8_9ACTN|nr:N-6 DNA methylase [Desertihabitans brevis]RCK68928.1 methyltransferase domain-containing protein [Desertihabitans brevis]
MPDFSSFDPAFLPQGFGQSEALDLDQFVDDTLTLTTIEGTEDFLQADLSSVSDIVSTARHRAAVTVHVQGTLRRLHASRLYSTAAIPLPGPLRQEPNLTPLLHSLQRGTLRTLTTDHPIRFRVGSADSNLRQRVIGNIEASLGWINDPADWDVNITTDHASWTAQLGALYFSRRFPALDRVPWSTTPLVAETLVRLAKPTSGARVHDPCCGTATLLIATRYNTSGAQLSGTDHDASTLAIARANLQRHDVYAELTLANATPISAESGSLDRVISNLPFGKQVGSHESNASLYPALLHEIARTLNRSGRAVLLTEDKQLLRTTVQRTKGLKLVKERLFRYNGATPSAFVLTRTRR